MQTDTSSLQTGIPAVNVARKCAQQHEGKTLILK